METWSDDKQHLATMLFTSGCIKFGAFTLKSGIVSPIYIDLRAIVAFPVLLKTITQAYIHIIQQLQFNQIVALPYAALPLGTSISLYMEIPLLYPRKETKTYGTKAIIEGIYAPNESVVVIDDLITSGNSMYEAIEKLHNAGLLMKDFVVLIDRENGGTQRLNNDGYNLHSVFKISDLLKYWKRENLITVDTYLLVLEFLRSTSLKS